MLAHHFSHYYIRRCQRMVFELAGVINPSTGSYVTNCRFSLILGLDDDYKVDIYF